MMVVFAGLGLALGGCPEKVTDEAAPAVVEEQPILDPSLGWHGDNRERLEAMIRELGGERAAGEAAPVAVFDWDNTVIKNDIGDVYLAWMINHDLVLQPPDGDWSRVSPWLTSAAIGALQAACGEHPAGQPMPTSTDVDCADELFGVYEDAATTAGEPAWRPDGYHHRSFRPGLAWPVQLQAGHTIPEAQQTARDAIEGATAAEIGSVLRVGSHHELPAWIRIYEESRALIGALQAGGFDVWIVSASPEPAVVAFAERVGVAADHVIGIRSAVGDDDRITHHLQGCGPVQPGQDALVTYMDGKRCWINKVIFGDTRELAIERQPEPARRPAFVAGDATTDVSMLRDATALRLVLNRNQGEVMCHAYHDQDGRWLVNPMYIDPLPQRAEPYPCSTSACKDGEGNAVECLDDEAEIIPDQGDRGFVGG